MYLLPVLAATPLLAQQTYSKADAAQGKMLFHANCVVCHGPEGDAVPGIDLERGRFRRVSSDEDIVKAIRNGVPGTAMPAASIPEFQARFIVAYLRTQADEANHYASTPAGISRGKAIFDGKGECLLCHRVSSGGSRVGPDLSAIGLYRRPSELEQSILDPNAEILPQNRMIEAILKNGKKITGRLLNQDTFTVQIMDSNEDLTSISKADLVDFKYLDASPMPSYRGKLSQEELGDLVAYLTSLKGPHKQ